MEYLVGLIAVLTGLFVYERGKRKAAESLNTNLETKEKVQQEQAKMDKVDAQLSVEEAKRVELEAELQKQLNRQLNEDLAKFFNDRLNNNK
jgi:cell fate regulator YaaT (PSP1 superfamily)